MGRIPPSLSFKNTYRKHQDPVIYFYFLNWDYDFSKKERNFQAEFNFKEDAGYLLERFS